MTKFEILRELMDQLDEYESQKEGQGISTENFLAWVSEENSLPAKEEALHFSEDELNVEISSHVGYLYRYAKHYTKKALQNTILTTLDDYVFLVSLLIHGEQNKTNLIQAQLLEISSGMEVIKRLLKNGLIDETGDRDDKRSKKVKITPKGIGVLEEVNHKMSKTSEIVGGNLSEEEKKSLVELIKKLKNFHDHIHEIDRKSSIEKVYDKYIKH